MKEIIPSGENLREEVKARVLTVFADFLNRDSETSVSEAQMKAYEMVVEAIPEGQLKDFAERLKGFQETSSKINQAYYTVQDKTWDLARAVVITKFPLAALIPEKPFSKLALKSSQLGGKVTEKIVRTIGDKFTKKQQGSD